MIKFSTKDLFRVFRVTFSLIVVFSVSWELSAFQFLQASDLVSSVFFYCGSVTAATGILGLRWLPLIAVIAGTVPSLLSNDFALGSVATFIGSLRVITIYGALGIYLRYIWFHFDRRFSLRVAIHFVTASLMASFFAALIAMKFTHFGGFDDSSYGDVFLSFWGGDIAGLIVTVPTIYLLYDVLSKITSERRFQLQQSLNSQGILICLFLTLILSVFVAWLPNVLHTPTQVPMLLFIPILICGLSHGAVIGFTAAGLACAAYLITQNILGADTHHPIEVYVIFSVACSIALIAGAARDDYKFVLAQSFIDPLTGLPNRRAIADRLEQALHRATRTTNRLAIMYIDLDRFKEVNDTFGHDAGDQLLLQFTDRIKNCTRASDTFGRLGGDEFVLIMSDFYNLEHIKHVANKVLSVTAQPFVLENNMADISASIGIAIYPEDSDNSERLRTMADGALYQAKNSGRNQYCFVNQISGYEHRTIFPETTLI